MAHCHSTLAKAFTLLKFYSGTHPGIHSAAIMLLHSSIIRAVALIHHRAHSIYACTGKGLCARVCVRSHVLVLSRVHTGAHPCFCVFSASTAAPRCSTVRAARAGRLIRMLPGRPLRETALRDTRAAQAAAAQIRRQWRR